MAATNVKRVFVEKKSGFDVEARKLFAEFTDVLEISGLVNVRVVNRYDVEGITEEDYLNVRYLVFADPAVETVVEESFPFDADSKYFGVELLPSQYDQRADSTAQIIELLCRKKPIVKVAKIIILEGDLLDDDFERIKRYLINPIESQEVDLTLSKPDSLATAHRTPGKVAVLDGFCKLDKVQLAAFHESMGLAMSLADLTFCQEYFNSTEKRDPTITELRVIDTYWSDHCRHTTFLTELKDVQFEEGKYATPIIKAWDQYLSSREFVYGDQPKDICLMDIAVIAMKECRKRGLLDDLEISNEINACSIIVEVDVNGQNEEWLVMFKNETHNHPTEIEPFGGAATCLGGAIRDPLSGRAYVYQAMRITGSGDPRTRIEDTLPGKLPQRTITLGAANGYSSYGNQIGVTAGQIHEIYDEGYIAKRMELGAVIAAAPRKNVIREEPVSGDQIILVGGRTGRDGCGGATGSSKEHTEESLATGGSEVQKGNPVTERKIQRLFRKTHVSRLIKKCNDFGAGGVSVAIGELADGLFIDLNAVPVKYEGLDGTELAISESQERMAVVVAPENVEKFIEEAKAENLEAVVVAKVTEEPKLRMVWNGQTIVDISRAFLNTNGVKQSVDARVVVPSESNPITKESVSENDMVDKWFEVMSDLNSCSQKGLVERFDSSVGAATVLMPFGGKYQLSPSEGMAAKIPVLEGETNTATLMTFGYNPTIAKWSPFHSAYLAVVESIAKIVAMGGDYRKVRLTLQEYFEKLGQDPVKWGKPLSALLGALKAQNDFGTPAVGGKDSMSGTFEDLDVPPTVVSFAVCTTDVRKIVSTEFKEIGSSVVFIPAIYTEDGLPDASVLKANFERINALIHESKVLAAHSVRFNGVSEAISRMCFGNKIGINFNEFDTDILFSPNYGGMVLEISNQHNLDSLFEGINYIFLGTTIEQPAIKLYGKEIQLDELIDAWLEPLETVYPINEVDTKDEMPSLVYGNVSEPRINKPNLGSAQPRVLIPIFPGTNGEYDLVDAFSRAGAKVETLVIKNLSVSDLKESIAKLVELIGQSQILAFPGGSSMGGEPDGAAKFIGALFKDPSLTEAITKHLDDRDGLILGIGEGFHALIRLGLLPHGKISESSVESPVLTYNPIGRHISRMVQTKVVSKLSPWLSMNEIGEVHTLPVSHAQGRFSGSSELITSLALNGQIATQYVDLEGNPTMDPRYNPFSSFGAIEGITSPDGRVFGKLAHSERISNNVAINIPGSKEQNIFEAGVSYFK